MHICVTSRPLLLTTVSTGVYIVHNGKRKNMDCELQRKLQQSQRSILPGMQFL